MTTIKKPNIEFIEKDKAIVVKKINIDEQKNSLTYTYRKDKENNVMVTGFDVKVYGDSSNKISNQADQLIIKGLERMQNPFPKGD